MINNKLIDNSKDALSMVKNLRECITQPEIKTLMIATGYWDIPGLTLVADELKAFLEREGTRLLLLIGKDPYIYAEQLKNPKYKDANYPVDYIRTDLDELEVKEEYETAISLLLDHCTDKEDSKIQIRVFRTNENDEQQFFHSKCYIFDGHEQQAGYAFIGSSNFTKKGLEGNAELNYLETSPHIIYASSGIPDLKTYVQWFNEKWDLSTPWNKEFLEQVLEPAPITKKVRKQKEDKAREELASTPFTPYELYIKLLQTMYGDIVDKNLSQQIEAYLPEKINKLDYQIDAVKRCINIMHEHGGFMLADVVGLGKTIVGALIIKRFLTMPEDDGRERKVLIVSPPAIQSGWKNTIKMFDKDEDKISPVIDYITTGRIGSVMPDDDTDDETDDEADSGEFNGSLEEKNYGLIIIDESHKFRNNHTLMYEALDELIQKIGLNTGEYPYIGLLSATPQNNRPNDLRNQIYLFERNHNDSTLKKAEGGNLERFFSNVSREYDNLKNITDATTRKQTLLNISTRLRECVLDDILERRTRTDVMKFYKEDIETQGLVFPHVVGPNNLEYKMDEKLAQLFYDTMQIIAPTEGETKEYLSYYRYRAIEFLQATDSKRIYEGRGDRNVGNVANQLARLMQMLLVKRLESSFSAFTQSLLNLRRYTENMIEMWENDTIFICPQIDISKELDTEAKKEKRGHTVTFAECVEDIRKKIEKLTKEGKNTRGQNAEYKRNDFKPEYIDHIKRDHKIISKLYDRWSEEKEYDPKLDTFKEVLKTELFNPEKNVSGKLVIFSEAIDTVNALTRAVKAKGYRVLDITAANRDQREQTIIENFDANYEGDWKHDYDVIITTEVLAEGINLNRANVILNYDTPWNSTRLMQRIGRVNRIASKLPFENIFVYNFMPSAEGDEQIQLVRRAHTKLQSFHVLFGEDNKIFSEQEDVFHYDIAKAVDGEESPVQKYVFELKKYKENNPQRYEQIEQTNEGWEIASTTEGNAYFVVKREHCMQLYMRIWWTSGEVESISRIDLLEEMRVDEDTPRVELPESWKALCDAAILEYNQRLVSYNRTRAGTVFASAIDTLVKLYDTPNISENSQRLLKNARKLVSQGNRDIAKKVLAIRDELGTTSLLSLTQEDIDKYLENAIGQIIAQVKNTHGEAKIILATIK